VQKFRTQSEVRYKTEEIDEVRYRTRPVTTMFKKTVPVYNIVPKPPAPPRIDTLESARAHGEKSVLPTATSYKDPGAPAYIPATASGNGRIHKDEYSVHREAEDLNYSTYMDSGVSASNDRLHKSYAPNQRIPADFLQVNIEEKRGLRPAENLQEHKFASPAERYYQKQDVADSGLRNRTKAAPSDHIDRSTPMNFRKESVEQTAQTAGEVDSVQGTTINAASHHRAASGATANYLDEPNKYVGRMKVYDTRNNRSNYNLNGNSGYMEVAFRGVEANKDGQTINENRNDGNGTKKGQDTGYQA